jgi:hypothetical protein
MSNFGFAQACSSSNSSFTTVVLWSCGQVSRISLPPPPPPPPPLPSCTEFNNFKYRVRRRFQSPYLRRSSLHSACSYSLPFPLASSVSASRGSFSGYRRRKLEVRASASELFQQEHGEGKPTESAETPDIAPQPLRNDPASELKRVGSNLSTLLRRFLKVAAPYWSSEDKVQARLRLAGLFALTLATTGISVGFNFLGRDFDNALASKSD